MEQAREPSQPVQAQLGLWDAVSIIIGIIIGATIYETPPLIYSNVTGFGMTIAAWVLGGVLSLIGAFCYAELATTYPRSGGDYVYLTRAYGPWMGFLFGWAQLTVIQTGALGMLAYIFADYTLRLLGQTDAGRNWTFLYAAAAVAILTGMNVLGIVLGKRTQNVLTTAKILGLAAIVISGLFWPQARREYQEGNVVRAGGDRLVLSIDGKGERTFEVSPDAAIRPLSDKSQLPPLKGKKSYELAGLPAKLPVLITTTIPEPDRVVRIEEARPPAPQASSGLSAANIGFAMVLIFLAYSGYNDAAYVAAEVRNRRRYMPLALIVGVVAVTLIYVLINVAYLHGLGFGEARRSDAIAADALGLSLGKGGEKAMCLVVMISALGAINGSTLTGSRIFSAMGAEHRIFGWLGSWNRRLGSPTQALLIQGIVTIVLVLAVGTEFGQNTINEWLKKADLAPLKWEGHGGFETLLKFTTPVFWLFFLLTGLSVFVLRERDHDIDRPFKVPLYPLLPLVFCGACVYMLHSGINYAEVLGLAGPMLLLVGLLLYWLSPRGTNSEQPAFSEDVGSGSS